VASVRNGWKADAATNPLEADDRSGPTAGYRRKQAC
jgi:hypothetical protein